MQWQEKIIDFVLKNGPKLLGAFLIFAVGWMVAGRVRGLVESALERKQVEPPVRMLIGRIVHALVLVLTLIISLDTVGIPMTTVIAGISVAGVGIGLAMQGVLSNLVAGLLIIFTKRFRVGEFVDLLGEEGVVDQIELFSTTLRHPDLSRVVIPNRKIVGEVLHNYGTVRQLDLAVGVAYDTDLKDAIVVVRGVLDQSPRVLKEPTPFVGVTTLADSSIDISVRPWVKVSDSIVERFRAANIDMPFPQREVRMLNATL